MFSNNKNIEDNNFDEINFNLIIESLIREKFLILTIILISTFVSTVFSFRAKPVWRGGFNIVVKSEDDNLSENSFSIRSFSIKKNNDNATQRIILKSESVLMPVFQSIREYYLSQGKNVDGFYFNNWSKTLDIDYEKDTKVLAVKYQNEDKKLILKTLNLISKQYQDYSKKSVLKDLQNTIDYLTTQKQIMQKKSLISTTNYNKFAIDNGLGNIDGIIDLEGSSFESNDNNSSIQKISSANNSPNFSNAYERYDLQFQRLQEYETEYTELSSQLKPEAKTLAVLKEKIDFFKSQLKKPNEILIEYKRLAKTASRDEGLLNKIENNLEKAKLEQVKTPKAWETISTPTLERDKVSPNKLKIIFSTLFISFFLGVILALLKEKLSGIIYNKEKLINTINCDLICTGKLSNINFIKLFINKLLNDKGKIGLVNYKDLNDQSFLNTLLQDNPKFYIFDLTKNEFDQKLEKFIILIQSHKYKRNDILELNKYLEIYYEKILGCIFIEE